MSCLRGTFRRRFPLRVSNGAIRTPLEKVPDNLHLAFDGGLMKGAGLAVGEIHERRISLEELPDFEIQTPTRCDADTERAGRAVQGIITHSRIGAADHQQLDCGPRSSEVRPMQWSGPQVGPEREVWILTEQEANHFGLSIAAGNVERV